MRPAAPAANASKPAPPQRKTRPASTSSAKPRTGPVSPDVARKHFEELLKAKQERVRQGPSYPAPNAYTGRHDAEGAIPPSYPTQETTQSADTSPDAEATYGETSNHGRGNQGMREQK